MTEREPRVTGAQQWTPACMTADELAAWQEANASALGHAVAPCIDCPGDYERAMRRAGKCNAFGRRGTRRQRQAVERTRIWKARLRADVLRVRALRP